ELSSDCDERFQSFCEYYNKYYNSFSKRFKLIPQKTFTIQALNAYKELGMKIKQFYDIQIKKSEIVWNHSDNGKYRREFEEIELLGKGGYGYVYKAKNVIDKRTYAIKMVKMKGNIMYFNTFIEIIILY